MATTLDLTILSLAQQDGQEQAELPGLYAVMPPKHPARGREADSLVIYLGMAGNLPLSAEQYQQLLPLMAQKYYKTAGSVTAALRTLAEGVNAYLLDRNLRSSSSGKQGIGLLTLAVLRGEAVYLAQCGPVHAFAITVQETQQHHDPQTSGQGLGVSRTTPIRFLQPHLGAGDFLVLAAQAAAGWTESTLRHPARQGMEGVRRQMIEYAAGQNVQAVVAQVQPGSGQIRLLRRKAQADMARSLPAAESAAAPIALPAALSAQPAPMPVAASVPEVEEPAAKEPAAREPEAAPQPIPIRSLSAAPPPKAEPARPPAPTKPRRSMRQVLAPFLAVLGSMGKAIAKALGALGSGLGRLLRNVLPDESVLRLPPSLMIFLAVAVPLILTAAGAAVYVQRGRTQQAQEYYTLALEKAQASTALTEPADQRAAWSEALTLLDKADAFAVTSESQGLRAQLQDALDQIDWVERLDFQPAIVGGLSGSLQISRIVATETDLYLLNAAEGNVLHAILTNRGFELDTAFICGPILGPTIVGPLVDIEALPAGQVQNATLLGMDAAGNLLYCTPGGKQPLTAPMAPPSMNFGQPRAFTINLGNLYILDPDTNAVWIYENLNTAQPPRFFFGDTVPPLQDVFDLAVYNGDLFLLHTDGHITKCTYSSMAESPTRCEEPYPFTDPRPGRQSGAIIPDALFSQIYFWPSPGPSLYLLDPSNQAVYFSSVQLNLQRQYRPLQALGMGQASAFAVSPTRLVFLAVNGQVYYAALP